MISCPRLLVRKSYNLTTHEACNANLMQLSRKGTSTISGNLSASRVCEFLLHVEFWKKCFFQKFWELIFANGWFWIHFAALIFADLNKFAKTSSAKINPTQIDSALINYFRVEIGTLVNLTLISALTLWRPCTLATLLTNNLTLFNDPDILLNLYYMSILSLFGAYYF